MHAARTGAAKLIAVHISITVCFIDHTRQLPNLKAVMLRNHCCFNCNLALYLTAFLHMKLSLCTVPSRNPAVFVVLKHTFYSCTLYTVINC